MAMLHPCTICLGERRSRKGTSEKGDENRREGRGQVEQWVEGSLGRSKIHWPSLQASQSLCFPEGSDHQLHGLYTEHPFGCPGELLWLLMCPHCFPEILGRGGTGWCPQWQGQVRRPAWASLLPHCNSSSHWLWLPHRLSASPCAHHLQCHHWEWKG